MPPAAVSACGVLPCNFQNKTKPHLYSHECNY